MLSALLFNQIIQKQIEKYKFLRDAGVSTTENMTIWEIFKIPENSCRESQESWFPEITIPVREFPVALKCTL